MTGRSAGDNTLVKVVINEKLFGTLESTAVGNWSNEVVNKDGVLDSSEVLVDVITWGWMTLGIRTTTGGETFFGSSWIEFSLMLSFDSFNLFDDIWLVAGFTSSIFGVKVTENININI